jgi:hypothetical protein
MRATNCSSRYESRVATLSAAVHGMSQEVALDYFLVTRHSFQWSTHVPPFVIGRVLYDNWLVDYAVHHMDTIDATRTIRALHQVRPSMAHRRVPLALTRITLP